MLRNSPISGVAPSASRPLICLRLVTAQGCQMGDPDLASRQTKPHSWVEKADAGRGSRRRPPAFLPPNAPGAARTCNLVARFVCQKEQSHGCARTSLFGHFLAKKRGPLLRQKALRPLGKKTSAQPRRSETRRLQNAPAVLLLARWHIGVRAHPLKEKKTEKKTRGTDTELSRLRETYVKCTFSYRLEQMTF